MTSSILDRIDAPQDLKALTYDELTQVAQEARDTIISVITERGGHLASNLGVVELTLALHRVFDSPKDSIVWDTTNQLYTHKLVTGRRDEFKDIRLQGGISGFGEPSESPHDTLCAGHAGTGLSIALGIAQGASNSGTDSWTVAVVGDGAMTSGSSFEALNNIVHLNPGKDGRRSQRQRHVHIREHRLPYELAQALDYASAISGDDKANDRAFKESAHRRTNLPACQEPQ